MFSATSRGEPSPWARPAAWGVNRILGWRHKGSSAGRGSVWNTSSAAPARWARIQGRDQVLVHHMGAATDVDEVGALGQGGEGAGVEDARRLRRQRQDADQDTGAFEEWDQRVVTGETLYAFDRLRRPAPAGDRKAQAQQAAGRLAAEISATEYADVPVPGLGVVNRGPAPLALEGGIAMEVPVHVQHPLDDELHHPLGEGRIDQPHDGNTPGQAGIL